jgi:hypothetical protein
MMGDAESDDPGLIPRVCQQLFRDMEKMAADAEAHKDSYVMSFRAEVRYIEIYNEHVSDLLWSLSTCPPEVKAKVNSENMKVRSSPATGVFIEHLTSVEVSSWKEMLRLINIGNSCRHTAATKMNERSSRSHAIFKVSLTQVTTSVPKKQFEKPTEHLREAVINLVDLAGSERNKKTGATGDRLKEAASINKSLSCLKGVIDVLVENSVKGTKKRPPYRDSTLTSLLMDSLGGNSKTFMLVTLSPHLDNADETLQTLRYGSRARQIVHTVHVNENAAGRMMLELEDELEKMKKELERAKSEAQPEVIEKLRTQITEQEQAVATYEAQIEAETARITEMQKAKEKELRARERLALGNLQALAKSREARDEARDEYIRLRDKLQMLTADKDALVAKGADAEKAQEALREQVEQHKTKAADLDRECDVWRKKVGKLEHNRRELEDSVADAKAALERLRNEKHGSILRARYRCAQIRLETRAELVELSAKHEEELQGMCRDAEKERASIIQREAEKEAALNNENDALQKELDTLLAETARVEAERGSQVAQLDAELKALQAENKRKSKENAERLEAARGEWAAAYDKMAQETAAERERVQAEWAQRHEEAAAAERATMQANTERWQRELAAAREHWDNEALRARAECEKTQSDVRAEWGARLETGMATNRELRRELRQIEAAEREYATLQRRIAAVMDTASKPNAQHSEEYKSLYQLLKDFEAAYDADAPSMYRLQHLLRDDFLQTRCELAPLVGVPDEVQPARRRDPPATPPPQPAGAGGDETRAFTPDKPALRLRPRSPRRVV